MSQTLLTTAARVQAKLDPQGKEGGGFDGLITALIREASGRAEAICERSFKKPSTDYTHDLDGTGTDVLYLPEGPIQSVTSIHFVEYSEGTAGARNETLTEVEEYEYLTENLIGDGPPRSYGFGKLVRMNGVWSCGKKNYRVVWSGGYDFAPDPAIQDAELGQLPEALIEAVTRYVVARFHTTPAEGQISRSVGDVDLTPIPEANLMTAFERALRDFRRVPVP